MSLYTKPNKSGAFASASAKKKDEEETTKKEREALKDLLIAIGEIDGKEHGIYWTDNYDGSAVDFIKLKNGRSVPIKRKNQIYSAYISGSSGSGKSTECARIALDLLNNDKSIENVFFITSQTIEDPAFSKIMKKTKKVTKQIKLRNGKIVEKEEKEPIFLTLDINNPALYSTPIDFFKNSIFIFDDYEVLPKEVEKLMTDFVRSIITMGRKLNINPIIIRHKILNHNKTAEIILEAQNIITFPSYNWRDTSKFLENYMGFSKDEIADVRKLKTRALHIHKVVPNIMISNDEVRLI